MPEKYSITTYGCQMNRSDSERIASLLEEEGYSQSPDEMGADLIVVNMCSVRQSAVERVYGKVGRFKKLKRKNPKLKTILTGCILPEDREKLKKEVDLVLDIRDLPKWPKLIHHHLFHGREKGGDGAEGEKEKKRGRKWEEKREGEKEKKRGRKNGKEELRGREENYLSIKPKYQNKDLAFLPISTGCNNACTYCVVPFTRGPLVCRDHREIISEAFAIVRDGFKEILLLGENVNDYHSPSDYSVDFAELLKMINNLEGNFRFFFTSPHPKNFSDHLIDVLAHCHKFNRYINLPIQSGDDEILKKMNRNYTADEYKRLVDKIREKMPDIKLSTDIIVGFPGETKEQFQKTVKLFKEVGFNWAYIAKYSPRPGTVAARTMADDVPLEEKKRREHILREIMK